VQDEALDVSAFPIVHLHSGRIADLPGFERVAAGFGALFAGGARFAIISHGDHPADEPSALSSRRARFFREQRDAFRACVVMLIAVADGPDALDEMRAAARKGSSGTGIAMQAVGSVEEALALARQALARA
jgi:hypothetical protein